MSLDSVTKFWLRLDDAAPLVVVRTAWALMVGIWAVSLIPDFGSIFGDDGLNPEPSFAPRRYITLFRWVDDETIVAAALALTIVGAGLVVAGRALRFSVSATAFLQISLADHAWYWTIGAESVMRLLGVFLGLFALLTPQALQGHWPRRAVDSGATGVSRDAPPAGLAPVWPLLLIRLQVVLIYVTTALEKSRGQEWHEGTAVFHALELEQYWRFEPPAWLTATTPMVQFLTWGTLFLEFVIPALLLWPKTRRIGIVAVIVLHLGFDVFIELGFFGWAMIVGALAFLPPGTANRILAWLTQPWRRSRRGSETGRLDNRTEPGSISPPNPATNTRE